MELSGQELIAQPVHKVWDGLNDPQVLKACIPGCEEITLVADNQYKVVLMAAVGPVKARFSGKLSLSDVVPPTSYSLTFDGSGGAAGFAKGGAQVKLSDQGDATVLDYTAKANVGGKISQVGSRLIEGVARKIAADFFAKFNEVISPAPAQEGPGHPGASEGQGAQAPGSEPAHRANSRATWPVIAAMACALAAAYWFFKVG